jgi:ketosteroid isomerase-like protein
MELQLLIVGIAAALFTAGSKDDLSKELEQAVQTIQTAFNKGDVDTLKRLMTEDHVTTLSYAHFSNTRDQLKVLSDWKFSEYKIDGLTVKGLVKDVALVSYQASIEGTYRGKQVPSPVQTVEVWVKRDGKWLQATFQETPLDKK